MARSVGTSALRKPKSQKTPARNLAVAKQRKGLL
jgi:hypothetical protein